jgi:ATP-binding cassette, subfamily C, bacterial CydD
VREDEGVSADAAEPTQGRVRGPVDPRLLRYARASRGFLVVTGAIVLAQTGVVVGFAWLLTSALVGAIAGTPVARLWPLLAGAAALVLVRALLLVAAERVSARGAARASLQLRSALVAAVARLGPEWLGRRNSAALAVTAGHGLEALDGYFGRYLPQLVATAVTMPVLIGAILLTDWVSGVTVLLTIPLIPVFMVLIGLATRGVQRAQFDTLHRLAVRFSDTVAGLGTLKIFGRQHRAADTIERVTRRYKRETMTVLRVSFLSGFMLEFLASISVAIIAVTIGFRLLDGELDLLIGLFVLLLAPEAYLPLRQVGVQFHAAAEGVAATDEIFAVLDAAASVPVPGEDAPGTGRSPEPGASAADEPVPGRRPVLGDAGEAARLEVRGLRVRRDGRMLPRVDFALTRGRVVLLEGPSGAGKSSVVAALLGFADHDGDIVCDVETVPSARGAISWAGQRPGLSAGTVADNVALGDDAPALALVRACLADAEAGGIDPGLVLGAGGSGLSGGQAQRVAVARALYRLRRRQTPFLVLDEPSSALDTATEARLWAAIRRTADAGAGVLLVSHRRSARTIADDVVTLEAVDAR